MDHGHDIMGHLAGSGKVAWGTAVWCLAVRGPRSGRGFTDGMFNRAIHRTCDRCKW